MGPLSRLGPLVPKDLLCAFGETWGKRTSTGSVENVWTDAEGGLVGAGEEHVSKARQHHTELSWEKEVLG